MKTRKPAQYSYKSKRNEQPEESSIPDGEAVRGHTKMIMLSYQLASNHERGGHQKRQPAAEVPYLLGGCV